MKQKQQEKIKEKIKEKIGKVVDGLNKQPPKFILCISSIIKNDKGEYTYVFSAFDSLDIFQLITLKKHIPQIIEDIIYNKIENIGKKQVR